MDWQGLSATFVAIVGAFGGLEFIKWWMTRKSKGRIAEAEADGSEFHTLKETVEFLQEQLKLKEERFAEQTTRVRELTAENLSLIREVTMLKTERSMKLCERRNCENRQPQSGY